MTTNPTPGRTPYCHKIRYGITGAPILDGDEMDGGHASGVGLAPKLIELVYSPARDGKPASVDASVTGDWTRLGEPDDFGGQVTTHFKNGLDGWPEWLAEEARLHDPAASAVVAVAAPPTGQTAEVRLELARVLHELHLRAEFDATEDVDAVLAVLAPPADRAAVLAEAIATLEQVRDTKDVNVAVYPRYDQHQQRALDAGISVLRRLADEAQQQPETQAGDTAQLAKVARWVTSEPVTANTEFGNGYRECQRDIRDLLKGRFDYDPRPAVVSAVPPQPEDPS